MEFLRALQSLELSGSVSGGLRMGLRWHTFACCVLALIVLFLPELSHAEGVTIQVDAANVINPINRWMTGSCIEDVNHEIYGGLYDQKIFGESFEEPPPAASFAGWTAYGGSWQPDGSGGRVAADPGAKLVRDAPEFADGTVEADVRVADRDGGNAGLLVRVQNPGAGADNFDGYEVSLSASEQQVILGKHHHDWHPLVTAPCVVAPLQWHHLRVELVGSRIRVFVDGTASPLIDFTDTEAPLLSGKIALRTWNADAAFRDVRIKLGGTVVEASFSAGLSYSVSGMWDAVRTGSASAEFGQDDHHSFNGTYCQRIQRGAGTGYVGVANRGLNRWGIAVKKGQTFAGHLFLRASHLSGPVTVALQSADGSKTYANQTLSPIGGDWAKYAFTLTSRAGDPDARFAVWIDRPGTLWVDQAVLMGTGSERFHGLPVRADIAKALVAEGITFLRYGGTMVNAPEYRWKKMIGDPDKRPPYRGHWYPYSTNGFGIFDFLNFCEAAHLGAAFAINIEETAQDAADLADYLTAPVTNPWGRRRAEDGHSSPYHVRYIEIGNEESLGGDDAAAYQHYIDRFHAIAHAIHSRNAALHLVCAAWWRPDSPNAEAVFKALDGEAAAWDLHVWADNPQSGTDVDRQLAQMQQRFRQWNPKTTMKAVIFEENGGRHDMQRALGHATTLNAARRHGDFVLVDCPANCLQPWQQNDNGWDQGQIFFTPDHVWAMPPYDAQQMASQNYEPLRVQSAVSGSTDLDVIATRSDDAKTLVLSVVNTGVAAEQAILTVAGFTGIQTQGRAWTLTADLRAVNPPDSPPQVRPQESVISTGKTVSLTFPLHSYTIIRLTRIVPPKSEKDRV